MNHGIYTSLHSVVFPRCSYVASLKTLSIPLYRLEAKKRNLRN